MCSKFILNAIFLFSIFSAFSQTDTGKKVDTKLLKVNNNVYMYQGHGGNIGLSIGKDGIFMVDSQYAEDIEQIQEDIKKISDEPIRFLVNTHFHADHTGGNSALAKKGTIIFSQENTRERLRGVIRKETKEMTKEESQDFLPTVTFTEDITFHLNGERIYVFHLPNAHTDGDAMVYFTKNNVLHTGDILFNGKYPFIDLKNGGSLKGTLEALHKAISIINEDTKIIPGHGNLGSYKDLQNTIDMLGLVYKKVTANFINGKTEDQVAKMTDLTEQYDAQGFGNGFINTDAFLRMIYKSVALDRKPIDSNNEKNEQAREKVEQMKTEHKKKLKN